MSQVRSPGGSFERDRVRGKVLPTGDDWTITRSDGVVVLELRVTLETDDSALITFRGIRYDGTPRAPYFCTLRQALRSCRVCNGCRIRPFVGLEYFYRKGFACRNDEYSPADARLIVADSPAGILAFYDDKFTQWTYSNRQPEKVLSRDNILNQVTPYWLTNTGTSSSRSYWEAAQGGSGSFNAFNITEVPVAVTVFLGEIYRRSEELGELHSRS